MKDLILLHGALGAKKQFLELSDILKNNYRIHLLDFSGHGEHQSVNRFSIPDFSKDLRSYIDSHQIVDPYIFGYSMGGYVALHLEYMQPGSVRKIITLGTKFSWDPETSTKEAGYLNPEKIEEKIPVYANYLRSLHGENWSGVVQNTAQMMIEMGEAPPLDSEKLEKVEIPVVIGWGSLDKMVSKEESEQASKALINGKFNLLENVQHPIDRIDVQELERYILTHI